MNVWKEFGRKFEDQDVPRPHCGLYLVRPVSIEFWQGRPNRMHDRLRYTLEEDFEWKLERLAPQLMTICFPGGTDINNW